MRQDRSGRVTPLGVATAVVTLFGLIALLWSVVSLPGDFAGVPRESWGWLVPAVAGAAATYLATALALRSVAPAPLSIPTSWAVAVAESFTTMATPGGVGSVALTVDYLKCSGVETAASVSSTAMASLTRGAVELVGLPTLTAISFSTIDVSTDHHTLGEQKLWLVLLVVGLVAVAVAVVAWVPSLRHHAGPPLRRAAENLVDLLHHPGTLVRSLGSQVLWLALQVLVLWCTIRLVGASAPVVALGPLVIVAFLAQRTVPLPGALGAPEAVLIAGLSGLGITAAPAVAAVASYRMLTYWLPPVPGVLLLHHLRHQGRL